MRVSRKLCFMSVSRKLYPLPLLLSFSSALAQRQDSVSLSQDMLNDPCPVEPALFLCMSMTPMEAINNTRQISAVYPRGQRVGGEGLSARQTQEN